MGHPRPPLRIDPAACDQLLHTALAKREEKDKGQLRQSYFEHVAAVYVAWCGLKDVYAASIGRVAARHGITADRLLRSSLLCVALHDVGKLSVNFLRMMRAEDDAAYRLATRMNYRHEVAALWLVTTAARALNGQAGAFPGDGLLETMAVAGHHKYLADGYLFDEGKFQQPLTWEPDLLSAVKAAVSLAREMFKDQGWKFPKLPTSEGELKSWLGHEPGSGRNGPFDWLTDRAEDLTRGQDTRLRDLFVLLKGLLMTADWMASGAQARPDSLDALGGTVRVPSGELLDHLRHRVEERRREHPGLEIKPFEGYTPFQTRCGDAEGHVIAVAPTGGGKTEAAVLWALRQVERGRARKIMILLPTMVTANSIHKRLAAFFESDGYDDKVGLVHSTADLVRQSAADEDETDKADVRADHLSETHFFRPVTVGTVDQLLVPLFHAGRWALKTLAAANSAVVIDEVHAYEPHTLGLITLMIRQLAPLGTRFMVMSATMPRPLVEVIGNALTAGAGGAAAWRVEKDDDLLDSARNTWKACDTPLSEWLLVKDARGRHAPSPGFLNLWAERNDRGEPLNILVVVNTVKRCQDLAKALRGFAFELTCYHSKFIFDHRREKERRIDKRPPRLLIATQVVEVSLDIDYDILLTECAPMDALAQRAGRVNRARRKMPGRVVVHPPEKGSETVYGSPHGVLDATWDLCRGLDGPLSERELIASVEQVYAGHAPAEGEGFRSAQAATGEIQRRLAGVLDSPRPYEEDALLKTRKESYPQLSVIPECFGAEAHVGPPAGRKRFELKVPVWYARRESVPDELPLCRMEYTPEFGAELIASEDHPEPGHEIF
jgi:CRISPR-associated endonuclease/helicase Cas3